MDILNQHFWKFLIGLFSLMLFGLSVAYVTNWYERQQQDYTTYEAQYLHYTNGSTTISTTSKNILKFTPR